MTSCYLCGSPEQQVVRTKLRNDVRRSVLRCSSCSLVWLEPKQADLKEYYREQYRREHPPAIGSVVTPEENFLMYEPFMEERITRVQPYLNPSMRVLEIGCATGHFLAGLGTLVTERVGVEFNESHAQYARQRLDIEVYTDPIEETDRPKGSFDFVFMFHVLEHVEDPVGLLRTLRDYLAPGGKLYVEVPNVNDALLSDYKATAYADFYYREPHLFYFSPATFQEVATRAGFVGHIEMVQRYGLANHIHWVTAGTPQPDAQVAMGVPKLVVDRHQEKTVFEDDLDRWLARADREYRSLLSRHERAEAMALLGEPGSAAGTC